MGRSAHSDLTRRLREAHAACEESAATGVPIDEVADIRAGRRVCQRRTACEVVETYNDAAQRVLERGAPEDHLAKWVAMENVKRVGRREFLTGAAKAGAGIAASVLVGGTVLRPERAVAGTKQPTIAIVGAGLAGLRCAHMLYAQKGWTSTIYEATSDIGGRCETQRSYWKNGLIAEMHGEFISSEHSSVLGLASLFNLSLENTRAYPSGTVDTYWVNGARYTQAQLDADWQSWAWSLFQSAIKQAPWPQSYNSYNATGYAWDHMSVPEWINRYMPGGTAGNFGAVCLQNVIDEYGGDPSDQSSLNLTMILGYYDSKGPWVQGQDPPFPYLAGTDELYHITGGNDQIVNGLVNQLPAGTIKTGEALVALVANSNGTSTLTFQNGSKTQQVTVDSVVLALPFKTLQNVDLSKAGFSPLKMTAINTLGMGTDAKIIMQFNGEPWSTNGYTGTTYQDLGFISSGWQMVQSAAAGGYTGPTGLWTAYPGGNYTPSIISKYNLTNSSGTPPPKMVSDTLGYLEPVFPGVTAAYNGLAWYDFGLLDPYLQGAYSYWRVGQYTGFSGYEGAQEGHVHFAGEHTTQDFQGYMEGATLSGERCAKEIGTGGG
jgi:monoamine oxidase